MEGTGSSNKVDRISIKGGMCTRSILWPGNKRLGYSYVKFVYSIFRSNYHKKWEMPRANK